MKWTLTVSAVLLMLVAAAHAAEAKAGKPAKANKERAGLIRKYDLNKNGAIDADEVAAIQKAFAADPALKPFDKNGDGRLDETEVSAINPVEKKKKK